MRNYLEEFEEKDEKKIQKFLDDIKKFNDELKKSTGKIGSSSSALTEYITEGSYEIDDGKVEEKRDVYPDVKPSKPFMNVDIKPPEKDEPLQYKPAGNVPLLPPPPASAPRIRTNALNMKVVV